MVWNLCTYIRSQIVNPSTARMVIDALKEEIRRLSRAIDWPGGGATVPPRMDVPKIV